MNAISKAMDVVKHTKTPPVPVHLQDAHYHAAEKLGHGMGYKYAHNYRNHYVRQQYLPDGLTSEVFYEPSGNGYEAQNLVISLNKVTTKKWNTEECSNRIDLQRFHLSCRFSPTPPQSLQKPNQDVATLLVRNHTI